MKFYKYKEIEHEINKIESLDYKGKDIVLTEIKKYLSDNKLTYEELEKVIKNLRSEFKISQVDEKYLNQLLLTLKKF